MAAAHGCANSATWRFSRTHSSTVLFGIPVSASIWRSLRQVLTALGRLVEFRHLALFKQPTTLEKR